jgi:DNA-binding Lrp family transcriptional regulator
MQTKRKISAFDVRTQMVIQNEPAPAAGGQRRLAIRATFGEAAAEEPDQAMPTAIVLLKIDHRRVTRTAEKILEIPSVTEVYSVSGRHDLLVIIKCESVDMIECVITDGLLKTDGIVDSETLFAFRSYDKREAGRAIEVD